MAKGKDVNIPESDAERRRKAIESQLPKSEQGQKRTGARKDQPTITGKDKGKKR